jgi:hypothetical protein
MKMKRSSLHYLLLTARLDQFLFPLAFWALFVIIGIMRGPAYILDTARAYLGAVIPLIGGILASHAVLDDPSLELRFATPIPAAQTLFERLAPIFIIQVFTALAFQGFALLMGADFTPAGAWFDVQLAWLVPTLSLMAFGCLIALLSTQSNTGTVLTGLVWLVQLVARGWFAQNVIGQYLLVFMSPFMNDHPALRANQGVLLGLSCALLLTSWALLRRQERYL